MPPDDPPNGSVPGAAPPSAADRQSPERTPEPAPAPLLELRDGLPPLVDTAEELARAASVLARGTGPVAVDAERASGYRYSSRAYLVQLRREGAGTALVDPVAFPDLTVLGAALGDVEWILHAASQDLPCLAELGLRPASLFDTELAGRLLGYPRVGLATLVEELVGRRLRKEHSAVDWSTRPLPASWLEYAALDVEALVELRTTLADQLERAGKSDWARQEFDHLVMTYAALADQGHPVRRTDPWRRTSGVHRAKGRRALAVVRGLWHTRDEIAARRDVSPGRIIPDSAIVAAANALPGDKETLLGLKGFRGRGARRYAARWLEAVAAARDLPDDDLPALANRYDGPPPARAWPDKNPEAAARLREAREQLGTLARERELPVENLLAPDTVRRLMWAPPTARRDGELPELVTERLVGHGARPWQVELTCGLLTRVLGGADGG